MLKKAISCKKIGEMLTEKGIISKADLIQALEIQKTEKLPIGRILINLNKITKRDLYLIISEQYGIKIISLRDHSIDYKLQSQFSQSYAKKRYLIILRDKNDGIKICSSDPDTTFFGEIKNKISRDIKYEFCIVSAEEIEYAHRSIYALSNTKKITYIKETCINTKNIGEENGRLTMLLIDNIIETGCRFHASDIHIEPLRERIRVRYRIDGDMREIDTGKDELQSLYRSVVSRFKVIGKLIFDLKEQPQGGSFSIVYDDGSKLHHIDYRISLIPTKYGESVVLRVLNQTMIEELKTEDIGITGDTHKKYSQQIHKTNGLILIAGPTGSGKTTTLYVTIKSIAGNKKIITVEDPIEYVYPDEYSVTQTQINENRGAGFEELMNEIVHHDPDIIVIGEIRNRKSCRLAVEAARTGHLVFATIHAEDSTGVIPRMCDMLGMKMEEFLGQAKAVIAQRLLKRICFSCAEKFTPAPEDVEKYFGNIEPGFDFYHGTGCNICNHSGLGGRIGIYELWTPTRKIISDLRNAGSDYEIRQAAIAGGLQPFYLAGIDLMKQGKITLDKAIKSIPNIEEDRELLGKDYIKDYLNNTS